MINKKEIIVISVRDKDGYYVPLLSSDNEKTIDKEFIAYSDRYRCNKYFDFSYPPLKTIIYHYEEYPEEDLLCK